jgi:GWxTD domain-containing protein
MKKLVFLLLLGLQFTGFGQKPKELKAVTSADIMPSIIAARTRILEKDTTKMLVYLEIEFSDFQKQNLVDMLLTQYRLAWFLVPDYGSREKLSTGVITLNEPSILQSKEKIRFSFEIARLKRSQAVLFIEMIDNTTKKKTSTDALVRFENLRLSDQLAVFDQPESFPNNTNFITVGQRFMVSNPNLPAESLFMIQYEHSFDQAQSPMATTPRVSNKNMKVNVVRRIQSNKMISFAEEGLYFVVRDTANLQSGIAILGVDDRFPRLTMPEQIAKPLVYVSTQREMSELQKAEPVKPGLDAYFLKIMRGNQRDAHDFVKEYFRNVEEANRLFTTYKEGWKTDKGMIFTVLGPPNKVQRSRDREVWTYSQNQGFAEMIFNFLRKPNQFSDSHYELIRYPEYQDFWYEKIEEWRKTKK